MASRLPRRAGLITRLLITGSPKYGALRLNEETRKKLLRAIEDGLLPRIEKNEGFSSQPKTEGDEGLPPQVQEAVDKLCEKYFEFIETIKDPGKSTPVEHGGPDPAEESGPVLAEKIRLRLLRTIKDDLLPSIKRGEEFLPQPKTQRDKGQPSQVQKVMNELLNTYSAAGLQAYTGYTAQQMFAELSPNIADAWLKCVDARQRKYTDIDTCQLGLALMSGLPERRWDELIKKAEMGIISSFSIEKHFSFPKKEYWNDIMKAGLANVKGGASTLPRPAECVQECCEEILKAAKKAEVPTKEALGLEHFHNLPTVYEAVV